jgi:glycogen debranching enzyme
VRQSSTALLHQGWKDSQDSVFHADGSLADGPIALCEVQAYVYDARRRAAAVADALGDASRADQLRHQAEQLRAAFESAFWCEEESTYALALDGAKRPCRVRTSNAGHCLFGGIASPERARRVADGLVGPDMFSGWGIRTVAHAERRYNPMSYHDGSVWPHDNGIAAAGCARYGLNGHVAVPFEGLFEASAEMDGHRLPELFCGFHRQPGEGPTLCPAVCSPQAWASGVVFQLLACLPRRRWKNGAFRGSADAPAVSELHPMLDVELPFGRPDLFEQHPPDVAVGPAQNGRLRSPHREVMADSAGWRYDRRS